MGEEMFHRDEFERVIIKRYNLRGRYRGMERLDRAGDGYQLVDINNQWSMWCAALSFANKKALEDSSKRASIAS